MSNKEILKTFSGPVTAPITFLSTNNELAIKFTSDGAGQYIGYEATYEIGGNLIWNEKVIVKKKTVINVSFLILNK